MPPARTAPDADTVTAPLARWARMAPGRMAIDDGTTRLDFATLARRVADRAARLDADGAPSIAWAGGRPCDETGTVGSPLSPDDSLAGFLTDFLAIAASGRAAAVADPDWPPAVRADLRRLVAAGAGPAPGPAAGGSDFYLGFTSGSTGRPKGFVRSHASWTASFRACLDAFGDGAAQPVLAPGRPSHSLFLFGMLLGLWTGAGVTVQPRFSAQRALDTLRAGGAACLVAVPSQLLLMLDLARRRGLAPVPGVRLVMISGARWMRHRTPALRALLPGARIVEFYGASETSFVAWTDADPALPDTVVGRPFAGVRVRILPPSADTGADAADGAPPAAPAASGTVETAGKVATAATAATASMPTTTTTTTTTNAYAPAPTGPAGDAEGLIFVRSPMLFRDYVAGTVDTATAVLRDGGWLSVRDIGRLDADGWLHLHGRARRMLVTQGKNVFAEEVERVLADHPAVRDASVHGLPDPLRGLQLAAAVTLEDGSSACDMAGDAGEAADAAGADGASDAGDAGATHRGDVEDADGAPVTAAALAAWCRARLEPHKVPRRMFRTSVGAWPRTPGGKTDHARLAAALEAPPPWLRTLP